MQVPPIGVTLGTSSRAGAEKLRLGPKVSAPWPVVDVPKCAESHLDSVSSATRDCPVFVIGSLKSRSDLRPRRSLRIIAQPAAMHEGGVFAQPEAPRQRAPRCNLEGIPEATNDLYMHGLASLGKHSWLPTSAWTSSRMHTAP